MTEAQRQARAAAELRYNGPIPPEVIDRLKHGSVLKAEIVRCEDSIAFFKGETRRMLCSSHKWLLQGNRDMHGHNRVDARFYRLRWMTHRARLKDLRATDASLKGAQQFFDTVFPKEPDTP